MQHDCTDGRCSEIPAIHLPGLAGASWQKCSGEHGRMRDACNLFTQQAGSAADNCTAESNMNTSL